MKIPLRLPTMAVTIKTLHESFFLPKNKFLSTSMKLHFEGKFVWTNEHNKMISEVPSG